MANTPNLVSIKPVSEYDAAKVVTYNTLADEFDASIAGMLTLSVAGGVGDTALTRTQALNKVYKFTGAITGNRTVSLPTLSAGAARAFVVWNATTGAFTLTVKTTAGTGIAVSQNKIRHLIHDGTNVLDASTESGAGTGDFSSNTATSVDSEIVIFSGAAGKTGKRATQTGLLVGTSGVLSAVTAPAGAVVGTTDTQTLTNKRITKRVQSVTDAATVTPAADSDDCVDITALAQAVTIAAPTGTPTNFQPLIIRFKDNGTARAITWNAAFVAGGVALPATTVLSKILTVGFFYSTANGLNKWMLVASAQEA